MCFILPSFARPGVADSLWSALALATAAVFASGFHKFGALPNALDLAPKHPGSVFGLVNTAGSFSGSESRERETGDCVCEGELRRPRRKRCIFDKSGTRRRALILTGIFLKELTLL